MSEYVPFGSGKLYQAWSIGDAEARLDYFRNGLTGEEYRLAAYEPFVLWITSQENYRSAASEPLERLTSADFRIAGVERVRRGETLALEIAYRSERMWVTLTYEHAVGQPWIRKRARIRNQGTSCSLVSVALHCLRRADGRAIELLDCGYRFSYPAYGTSRQPDEYMTRLGMPSLIWGERGGLLVGIEFPACHNDVDEKQVFTCEYRPGASLETGQVFETEPAIYLAFQGRTISDARSAFQTYLRHAYPPRVPSPARFNTCGAWLEQATEDRVLATMPLAAQMGATVYVIDFGWSQYERFPFSLGNAESLPAIEEVEAGLARRELFPNGLERINAEARRLGLRLGLHYETSGFPHVEELAAWRSKSDINEGFCLMTPYGEQFSRLVLHQLQKYDLGELKLDFFSTEPCFAAGHDHLASGFDASDKQAMRMLELMRRARERTADVVISLFTGGGYTSPWWTRYADQLHSGDPGHNVMFKAMLEGNTKSQAMALERRDRWHWATSQGMRPTYCVQMDIHGYGIQATGTVGALMDRERDDSVPVGAGWKQTLFSNLALTAMRDIKVNPWYLSSEEREFLARWLEWARVNQGRLQHPRSILSVPNGEDLEGYAHVDEGGGFLFLFNPDARTHSARIDGRTVFGPGPWRGRVLYPVQGEMGDPGRELPVLAKDCLVLEIEPGVGEPDEAVREYLETARQVHRPFEALIRPDLSQLVSALCGRRLALKDDPPAARHTPAAQRLARRAQRWLDLISAAAAESNDSGSDAFCSVLLLDAGRAASPTTPLGRWVERFGATFWETQTGGLVDGCVVLAGPDAVRPAQLVIASTAPEHLARAMDELERRFLELADFRTERELEDPESFVVRRDEGADDLVSPLLSRSIRVLSTFSEDRPFALADALLGSTGKLGKPPAQRRGFLALPPAGGAVEARIRVAVPKAGQPALALGIGLVDQPNPSFGVNLSSWGTGVRFCLSVTADGGSTLMVDEPIFPELYPSGETPAYPELMAAGFRNEFLRPILLDLSRWRGRDVELCLRTEAPLGFRSLHGLPFWSPPRLLVGRKPEHPGGSNARRPRRSSAKNK